MTKSELRTKIDIRVSATRDALQTVYDALNKGQRQKLMKNENIVALFALYGVHAEQEV